MGFTFAYPSVRAHSLNLVLTLVAMAIGAAVAVPAARKVKMTAMPQMVAIFNGVGGGAAALISIVVFLIEAPGKPAVYRIAEVLFGVLVGCVSFSGSAIAFAKLQELMTGRPITYPAQQVDQRRGGGWPSWRWPSAPLVTGSVPLLVATAVLSLVLGVIFVLPIGGADVPVLISLLNSFTGLAVAASGFTLNNNLLIIAGTLVGASGILLTRMMSKAMGRSLANVLFSAFGSVVTATGGADGTRRDPAGAGRDPRGHRGAAGLRPQGGDHPGLRAGRGPGPAHGPGAGRPADGPGGGGLLRHPPGGRSHARPHERAAGRGQRPLRRAEGDGRGQPRDGHRRRGPGGRGQRHGQPGGQEHPGSPIYGMPIIHADQAENIVFLKRSMRPGFAGIDNELLFDDKTTLLFGDAKDTLTKLVAAVKDA